MVCRRKDDYHEIQVQSAASDSAKVLPGAAAHSPGIYLSLTNAKLTPDLTLPQDLLVINIETATDHLQQSASAGEWINSVGHFQVRESSLRRLKRATSRHPGHQCIESDS